MSEVLGTKRVDVEWNHRSIISVSSDQKLARLMESENQRIVQVSKLSRIVRKVDTETNP